MSATISLLSPMTSQDDDQNPTRRSLLSRLKDWGDSASWREFIDRYWNLIYGTARKAGLSDPEAEDVTQETLLRVCKNIREFKYDPERGRFKGWLLQTTMWRIKDHLRKRRGVRLESFESVSEDEYLRDASSEDEALVHAWDADWEKNLAESAIQSVKEKVSPDHFQIFDLAVFKQWSPQKIANALNVRTAYVYLIKHRISAQIKRELTKLRRDPIPNFRSRSSSGK